MREHRRIEAAYQLGRVIGFCWLPAQFLAVAYAAWWAAAAVWGR